MGCFAPTTGQGRLVLQTNSCQTIGVDGGAQGSISSWSWSPLMYRGSATPWLACHLFGGGGTQCKGLLSRQMASQVGQNHPKFEGGKVVSAVVMPPQAYRELQGKQNKTKQNMFCIRRGPGGVPPRAPTTSEPEHGNAVLMVMLNNLIKSSVNIKIS